MRVRWIISFLLIYEQLLFLTAAHYRAFAPVHRFAYNRRYQNYRSPLPKREVTCTTKVESPGYCFVHKHERRDTKWHNIADLRRDLRANPPEPSTTQTPEAITTPATTPREKQQKATKKVNVKVIKYVEVIPEGEPQATGQQVMMRSPGPMVPLLRPPLPPPMGPIPRWALSQPSPPWAQPGYRPPWAEDPKRTRWEGRGRPKPAGDALDRLLAEDSLKTKGTSSDEKWPLKGDSDRHRWESREGSDIYWELESTKKLATWKPRKTNGPIWKGGARSSGDSQKKWEEELDKYAAGNENEWNDKEHGGVPKPPLKYLKEHRRP